MPLPRHLLIASVALILGGASSGLAYAQSAADVAGSPAMRVYESTMMECFKTVMNVDPAAAALSKNKAALNM
ncbi:MAG TPA: hypothetical protein VGD95_00055, partial [Micavibrio sp.]